MISKPKTLVTLTVLRIVEGVGIHYAVTDGHGNTIQASSSNFERLENDFLAVVKELIQGHPASKLSPSDFLYGNWPERLVKFAIDPELVSSMISEYQENAEGAEIVKLSEYFINLFDKVNGNTAVSRSVGIAHLVKSFQDSPTEQDSPEPEMNWSDKLANIIYDGNAWDPEQQGVCFITEELDNGVEIDLNVVRAVGNVFITGVIGKVNVRIFKSQFINAYTSWDTQFTERSINFQLHDRNDFVDFIKGLTEVTP